MKVSFEGIDEQILSFMTGENLYGRDFVKVTGNNTVDSCEGGEAFVGFCIKPTDTVCDVMTHGYMEAQYSGAAPAFGYAKIAAAGSGKVKASDTGREVLVLKIDTAAQTVGFIM